jgi:hypothetical protein
VGRAADGGIDLALRAVDASTVEIIGAAPKAASLSGLACAPDVSGRWHARWHLLFPTLPTAVDAYQEWARQHGLPPSSNPQSDCER